MESFSSFNPAELRPMATKAVVSYIGKCFAGRFTQEDIEDIVSDVVMKAWDKRGSYDPVKGTLFSWIWKIGRNTVLDAVAAKERRRGIMVDIDAVSARAILSAEHADDELIRDDIETGFLERLKSERDRRIYDYLQLDLSDKDIAKREGITDNAAALAVYHLRKKLGRMAG